VERTAIRQVNMSIMLLGPDGTIAEKLTRAFAQTSVRLIRLVHAVAACERLPEAMPQVVVVIGPLGDRERDELTDRATAVGALVLDVDAGLDDDVLVALAERAATTAFERKLRQDAESGNAGGMVTEAPPSSDEEDADLDSNW
jgi:hypothetical protein